LAGKRYQREEKYFPLLTKEGKGRLMIFMVCARLPVGRGVYAAMGN
jgi:hypothetical protein